MDGGVIIASRVKRNKTVIDVNGNELSSIDPKQKRIVKLKESDYIPTPAEAQSKVSLPLEPVKIPDEAKGKGNPLAEAIKIQVQGLVKSQIQEVMKEIDIAGLVKQAIEEAFK